MSLTFNDLDDLLTDIAPLAFDGEIGFISDKRGGDWSKTYANLDPDIDSKELATLISIPDNPSRHMRDAIANGANVMENVKPDYSFCKGDILFLSGSRDGLLNLSEWSEEQ